MSKKFKILFFYPNEPLVGVASSNLAILSSCLKQNGFDDIKLFDCSMYRSVSNDTQDQIRAKLGHVKKTDIDHYVQLNENNIYDDFIKTIDEFKPDLIALSLVESTYYFSLSFLEKIQTKNIPVVAGGVGVTFLYDKILNSNLVDYVCVGEGEEAIVDLCNKLYNGEDCSDIKNIYTKDKNGNIIKNPLRPMIDINNLPMPDFSIYNDMRFYRPFLGRVVRTLQMDIDRGCPFTCTYCAAPSLRSTFRANNCGNYYRIKTWDRAFEEIKFLVQKYNLNFAWISSETFMAVSDRKFKEFADRYKAEINLPFWCQSRLDTFTEEKTKLLADMGCQNISVGLEHGSEAIREKLLDKRLPNKVIIEAAKQMAKNNIFPTLNNMVGLPGETREDVFETVKLNREISSILLGKHNINVFTFVPFTGTRLRELCIEKGYIKEGDTFGQNSYFQGSILDMPTMSRDEIKGLEKTLMLYILLPECYYPDIKIAEKDDDEGKAMFEKLVKIKNNL